MKKKPVGNSDKGPSVIEGAVPSAKLPPLPTFQKVVGAALSKTPLLAVKENKVSIQSQSPRANKVTKVGRRATNANKASSDSAAEQSSLTPESRLSTSSAGHQPTLYANSERPPVESSAYSADLPQPPSDAEQTSLIANAEILTPAVNLPPNSEDIPLTKPATSFFPLSEAQAMEISEAHAEFFHSVRSQWLGGEWDSLADLHESEFSNHPKRAKIALLVASALHELRAYDAAREALDRAMVWGANRRDVMNIVAGHAHAALGRACLAEQDFPRAETHFLESITCILPSKSALQHAKQRLFKEVLALGFLPDAQKFLEETLSDFQQRNLGSTAERSIFASKLELIGHELEIAIKRGQIGLKTKFDPSIESLKRAPAMLNADLKSRASSQWGQDLWVLEKTAYKRQGFFVEFGASDGVRLSNTYLLEKEFEWKGLCAEPNPEFFAKLAKNRSCVVSPDCISGQSGQVLRFLLADEYGGIVDFCNDMHDTKRQAYHELGKEITLRTLSLHDFLSKHSAPHTIDYLSLDTEGSEYEILSHFPFEKWDVRIISVEHNFAPVRDKIYTLLASRGYLRQELMADDLYYLPSNP